MYLNELNKIPLIIKEIPAKRKRLLMYFYRLERLSAFRENRHNFPLFIYWVNL
ncbi:unknown [[Mannheimia] succiniciproducens MBEL55E]|uniref:Uncharacterized protein n=1 Tax=Mannheimia succiniciproducens (strain KCTC 0769BP / MBEL55E) TaxID=221988 RepID=Q65RJ6_MANSM|nr:unknown [[Mannheimia] succiniciproducens MBEL55E]